MLVNWYRAGRSGLSKCQIFLVCFALFCLIGKTFHPRPALDFGNHPASVTANSPHMEWQRLDRDAQLYTVPSLALVFLPSATAEVDAQPNEPLSSQHPESQLHKQPPPRR